MTGQHISTENYSLNDSEDTKFIVIWVHCRWQVFNALLVSVFPVQAFKASLPNVCSSPSKESPCLILTFHGQLSLSDKAIQLWLHTVGPSKWLASALGVVSELVASASVMKWHYIPGQCIRKHIGINAEQLDLSRTLCWLRLPWREWLWGTTCSVWVKFMCFRL